MFWFRDNSKIKRDAYCLGNTLLLIRSMAFESNSIELFFSSAVKNNFVELKIVSDELDHVLRKQKTIFFKSGTDEIRDFKFWVTFKNTATHGVERNLVSEATGSYFGTMLFWSDAAGILNDVSVEISEIALKQGMLGRGTKALVKAILDFPGFTNNQARLKNLLDK